VALRRAEILTDFLIADSRHAANFSRRSACGLSRKFVKQRG
jgi:hypothetical protein